MAIALATPDYYSRQRDPITGKADIPVAGTGATPGHTLEARWNGGAWAEMTVAGDGSFSGTLVDQNSGQGDLEVRQDGGAVADTAVYVTIGSIFFGVGASNMSGRGTNPQSYSHATLKAICFKNNYQWAEMVDPTDSYTGQIDTVSKDQTPDAAGSFIPHLATLFMAQYGYPLIYVPCAKGSSTAEDWDDVGTNRATLFGSMAYRMQQVGGAELVLWMTNGDDIASYRSSMNTIADAIPTYGCDYLMQISGTRSTGYTAANRRCTWKEQARLARTNKNIVQGPTLRGIVADDAYHMLTDDKLTFAAVKIFEAIKRFKTALEGGNLRKTV